MHTEWIEQARKCKPIRNRLDELIKNSCTGKMRHDSLLDAQKEAARMSKRRGHTFNAYWCEFCDSFHIGRQSR